MKSFVAAAAASLALAADPVADKIASLPTFGAPPTNQYSGYLSPSATKHLHYWFVESEAAPATAPTLIWFNGKWVRSWLARLLTPT
jgi:cathepsin A (carboxypeptidase C)